MPFLLQALANRKLTLTAIWLTHGHLDHAGGVVEMLETHKVPVLGRTAKMNSCSIAAANHRAIRIPVSPAFAPNRWLEEGETLTVGRYAFQVLHIPGHTPGHVVFYCAEAELLIAGDVLFYETIGRTDFPRGNHADLINNIRNKLFAFPKPCKLSPDTGV